MKRTIVIAVFCVIMACNNSPETNNKHKVSKTNTVKRETSLVKKRIIDKTDVNDNLVGIWTKSPNENATFKIDKTTFYYPEHDASYKYKLKKDSVKVFYDDFEGSYAVKFKGKDTLILNGEDGESVFYRMK